MTEDRTRVFVDFVSPRVSIEFGSGVRGPLPKDLHDDLHSIPTLPSFDILQNPCAAVCQSEPSSHEFGSKQDEWANKPLH